MTSRVWIEACNWKLCGEEYWILKVQCIGWRVLEGRIPLWLLKQDRGKRKRARLSISGWLMKSNGNTLADFSTSVQEEDVSRSYQNVRAQLISCVKHKPASLCDMFDFRSRLKAHAIALPLTNQLAMIPKNPISALQIISKSRRISSKNSPLPHTSNIDSDHPTLGIAW